MVVVFDQNRANVNAVTKEIKDAGGTAIANCDPVSIVERGQNIIRTALDAFGRIDILIMNTGFPKKKIYINIEPETWNDIQDAYLNAAYNFTRPAFIATQQEVWTHRFYSIWGSALWRCQPDELWDCNDGIDRSYEQLKARRSKIWYTGKCSGSLCLRPAKTG